MLGNMQSLITGLNFENLKIITLFLKELLLLSLGSLYTVMVHDKFLSYENPFLSFCLFSHTPLEQNQSKLSLDTIQV